MFPKGQVVIPISIRKKYHIDIGDQIDMIPFSDGVILRPRVDGSGKESLTDSLCGIFSNYASEKSRITEDDIDEATAAGFNEGWRK